MVNDLEKKEEDKYEDVEPWKLVTEVPQALVKDIRISVYD